MQSRSRLKVTKFCHLPTEGSRRGKDVTRLDCVGEMSGEKSGHYASGRAPRMLSLTNGLDIDGLAVTFSDSLMLHTYIPTVT